jgi:hypothetical protein
MTKISTLAMVAQQTTNGGSLGDRQALKIDIPLLPSSLTWLVYTHTDYLDCFSVGRHYNEALDSYCVAINDTEKQIRDIDELKSVLIYPSILPYASRLLYLLNKIRTRYVLLIHENDFILRYSNSFLHGCIDLMDQYGIDRINLHPTQSPTVRKLDFRNDGQYFGNGEPHPTRETDKPHSICELPEDAPYRINVNPSLNRRDSLMDLLLNFMDRTYRTYEHPDVFQFSKRLNIWGIWEPNPLYCGYYLGTPAFKFLHITHYGKWLLINSSMQNSLGQKCFDIMDDYKNIQSSIKAVRSNRPYG